MNSLWKWLKGRQQKNGFNHGKTVSFCCSDMCKFDREVCNCNECIERHKGHTLMDFKKLKETYTHVKQEIKCRKQIEDILKDYNKKLISSLQQVLESEAIKMLDDIDKKIFGRVFIEIYKRDMTGKSFYSYLPQFKSTQGEDVKKIIQKTVQEKKIIMMEQFRELVTTNRILVEQNLIGNIPKIRNDPNQAKVDKIKSLMPFPCELTRKFQASKHRFQTYNLHKIGIRGPIVLVAESNKGRTFGGFSPKMFPRDKRYEEDNRCRSFLFSLDHRVRLPLKQEFKQYAIKGGSHLWFGMGDLVISDDCNKGNMSWANIGRAYELPHGIRGNVDKWLGGELYFAVVQYEIYEVRSIPLAGK